MGTFDNARGPRDFYSGRMNERDVLGEFRPTREGVQAFRAAADERGYITHARSMELIRQFSMEDPTNPAKPFAKELRLAVIDELGLEEDADLDRIRYYSAVGTALDHFHGVDAWMEFVPEHGRPAVVTMDATMNPDKLAHKADIIIQSFPDPSEDEEKFLAAVSDCAQEIADRWRSNVQTMLDHRERLAAK